MYYRRSFAVITEALLDQLSIGIQDVTRADPDCALSEVTSNITMMSIKLHTHIGLNSFQNHDMVTSASQLKFC